MGAEMVLGIVAAYFGLLLLISKLTAKGESNFTFFSGEKKSPWYLVAFGMIGASLSGVTFLSVPGWVGASGMSYFQMVLGYVPGYIVTAFVLLPLYYRLNLTSIYTFLRHRFGEVSYLTGSFLFLISRILGASCRLYLVVLVLQKLVFDSLGIPIYLTIFISIGLIFLYTHKGGIKTIVWTDTLQTLFMLLSAGICIYMISQRLPITELGGLSEFIANSEFSKTFHFDDFGSSKHFVKQFFSGMAIAIVMTGLDQDMMQKNLTCKDTRESQKNMLSFSFVLVFVNLGFLILGVLLYEFGLREGLLEMGKEGMQFMVEGKEMSSIKSDELFMNVATGGFFPSWVEILFVVGLVAAAYSSADSALTSLTTSFCVDILKMEDKGSKYEGREDYKITTRKNVHILMSAIIFFVILVIYSLQQESIIKTIFVIASFTYGPLLGLFAFGLTFKGKLMDKGVPWVAVIAIVISAVLKFTTSIGFELLIYNGAITFAGLWVLSKLKKVEHIPNDIIDG